MDWSVSEIKKLERPDFGPDPYFDPKKAKRSLDYGDGQLVRQHLEYMFRIVWPMMAALRTVLVGQRDMTTYPTIARFAVGDIDFKDNGTVRYGFGHVWFSDDPGKGKTLVAKVPAFIFDAEASRFQGVADALPADYTGSRIIQIDPETGRRIFDLFRGPAFSHIQLLDEFFRASPRTQGAALEPLGEGKITIPGMGTHEVDPYALLTSNPIESEGVYPASEAFLDRIMFKIRGHKFHAKDFAEILRRTKEFHRVKFPKICGLETVKEVQGWFFEHIHVPDEVTDLISRFAEIVNSPHEFGLLNEFADEFNGPVIRKGLSGRGVVHWRGAAVMLAALRYQSYVTPEIVRKVLLPTLRHRVIFAPNALRYFAATRQNIQDTTEAADFILNKLIEEAW